MASVSRRVRRNIEGRRSSGGRNRGFIPFDGPGGWHPLVLELCKQPVSAINIESRGVDRYFRKTPTFRRSCMANEKLIHGGMGSFGPYVRPLRHSAARKAAE